MPVPFPCSPAIRERLWKKTQIEKKNMVARKSNLAKILGQMVYISQRFVIIFIKNLFKNTILCVSSNA